MARCVLTRRCRRVKGGEKGSSGTRFIPSALASPPPPFPARSALFAVASDPCVHCSHLSSVDQCLIKRRKKNVGSNCLTDYLPARCRRPPRSSVLSGWCGAVAGRRPGAARRSGLRGLRPASPLLDEALAHPPAQRRPRVAAHAGLLQGLAQIAPLPRHLQPRGRAARRTPWRRRQPRTAADAAAGIV